MFLTIQGEGGLIERGLNKFPRTKTGAYLRGGGMNREYSVYISQTSETHQLSVNKHQQIYSHLSLLSLKVTI